MLFAYTLAIRSYALMVRIAATINPKARLWLKGRNHWKSALQTLGPDDRPIWFHCASVGEFEQARPVIEALKQKDPDKKVVVTFFSPSGFELRKNYAQADIVTYLPTDTPSKARAFMKALHPAAAVFVKYDFWFNTMQAMYDQGVPGILISAYIPNGHWLLSWPGNLLVKRLNQFDQLFLQDETSKKLLEAKGIRNLQVVGDTRIDRVMDNREESFEHPAIEQWAKDGRVLVVGSNWPTDDKVLLPALATYRPDLKLIVAPHEMDKGQWPVWSDAFDGRIERWTELGEQVAESTEVVYVDTMGFLSKLYRIATIAYVGGGFSAAVHNTLEPAAYNIPVVFGPNNLRFLEIQQLKSEGIGFEVRDEKELNANLDRLLSSEEARKHVQSKAQAYFDRQRGASEAVIQWLENR